MNDIIIAASLCKGQQAHTCTHTKYIGEWQPARKQGVMTGECLLLYIVQCRVNYFSVCLSISAELFLHSVQNGQTAKELPAEVCVCVCKSFLLFQSKLLKCGQTTFKEATREKSIYSSIFYIMESYLYH